MKNIKKFVAVILSTLIAFGCLGCTAFAADGDYTIVSPYADIIWEGDGAHKAYKGNLHTHSTVSDATVDYPEMIKEYYNQGYDFLAMTDHGVTGKAWNEKQTQLPLYLYQYILGETVTPLTDEEYIGITSGIYPLYDGTVRGTGMTCVVGGNELSNMTLTKSHVNGFFLPAGVGDGYGGKENGYKESIAFIDKNGGISHINHPGDWLETNVDINNVYDEEGLEMFSEILLQYDSCLGMEVFNEDNGTTGYDRILWDNLLMKVLPYGRTVIGFSNSDAHDLEHVDSSFAVYMMNDNSVESVKATMQSGAFFPVTRKLRSNDVIGPVNEINAMNTDIPYPMFGSVKVDGHKVTVTATDCEKLQWIANGKIIYSLDITPDMYGKDITIDLDTIEGAEDFLYIRCELFGKGGICLTQALVIDDGSVPLVYEEEKTFDSVLKDLIFEFKCTRFYVIIQELVRLIVDELKG